MRLLNTIKDMPYLIRFVPQGIRAAMIWYGPRFTGRIRSERSKDMKG